MFWAIHVGSGRQDRMMRFIVMVIRDKLKLLRAMFKLNATEKMHIIPISCQLRTFGQYSVSFRPLPIKSKIQKTKKPINCCAAVTKNEDGSPFQSFSALMTTPP